MIYFITHKRRVKNFEKAMEMIKDLQMNLNIAYEHFLIRNALKKSMAPNIKWKNAAQKNEKIMLKFVRFFWMTQVAHRKMFALELSKFFDKNKASLSLYKLINFIRTHINSFNKDNFVIYNKDRNYNKNRNIYDLANTSEPITNKVLYDIKNEIEWEKELIKKLKDYRNKNLAHNDIKLQNMGVSTGEMDELFKKTKKRLDKIQYQINNEKRWNLSLGTYTEDCVYSVLDHLTRFESYRLKEIEEEAKKEIKSLSNT